MLLPVVKFLKCVVTDLVLFPIILLLLIHLTFHKIV